MNGLARAGLGYVSQAMPAQPPPTDDATPADTTPAVPARARPARTRARRAARALGALLLVLVLLGTAALGVLAARLDRVAGAARDRLPRNATAALSSGSAGDGATNVLVIGDDLRAATDDPARRGTADAVLVLRVRPGHALSMLSLPRDLLVAPPRARGDRVASLWHERGAAATIRAVRASAGGATGVRIDHVVVVRYASFRTMVDRLGGVVVDNPEPLVASGFDGRTFRFGAGEQRMSGQRALAFARARASDVGRELTDSDRTLRQQLVVDAIARQAWAGDAWRHPVARARVLLRPVATDLGDRDLAALARAVAQARGHDGAVHCRLGGTLRTVAAGEHAGGVTAGRNGLLLVPAARNADVVRAFTAGRATTSGESTQGPFPAGCARANA